MLRLRSARFMSIACLLLSAAIDLPAATVEGRVRLPETAAPPVMAKRYEVVSRGGVLSMVPPVAVVWLEGNLPLPADPPDRTIVQEDFIFDPALLPVPVGTRVLFPNHDDEYHSVFSYSPTQRFDLGRYPPDARPIPSQRFENPGMVTVRCDIHEHMRAIILVLESTHFVLSDRDGHFALSGVPPGEYTLCAWVDSAQTLRQPIVVKDGETTRVNF